MPDIQKELEALRKRVAEAERVIETVAMYGRINHDKPRDYRELCQDYLKTYMPTSREIKK